MANVIKDRGNNGVSTHAKTILGEFMDRIKSDEFTDDVKEKLGGILADRESEKRVNALVIAFDNIQKLEADFKKMNPDNVTFDTEGNEIKVFSKNRFEERKKLEERIQKYDRAFGHAVGGDFKDLYELNNNFKDKGSGGKPDKGSDASETS